jgi:hypothetical protein
MTRQALNFGRTLCGLLLIASFLLSSLTGCGKKSASGDASSIDGVKKYDFQIKDGRATLVVTLADVHMDAGARIPLTRPAGAFIEIGPDFASGGSFFMISTPLMSLTNNSGLPMVGLPDGRPLPGIVAGAVQGTAVQLPIFGYTYLYMGDDVFGLFIPLELGKLPVTVKLSIRDEMGNLLGMLFGIPRGNTGHVSGLLFLFPMEGTSTAKNLARLR